MNGLVKEIQQWISPNRSKVYIISSSTHFGFIAPSLIQNAQLQEAAGSLQGVLFANNGETRGNAVKNYKKNMGCSLFEG